MSDDLSSTVFYAICVAIALFFVWDTVWFGRIWYGMANHVVSRNVSLTPKPHDCEFLTAPIGEKHCHYEASVAVINNNPKRIEIDWSKVDD